MPIALLTPEEQSVEALALKACNRIPPLWPLQNFVAVNPFLGLADKHFTDADQLLGKVAHRHILMDAGYYLDRLRSGAIRAVDIRAALAEEGVQVDPANPVSWLAEQLRSAGRSGRILTVADWRDQTDPKGWASFIVDEISKWCSSCFDRGQATWKAPFEGMSLYAAWRQAAELDANPECFGLRGFRRFVRELPHTEEAVIAEALELLDVPPSLAADFLHRELMSVSGWSAWAAYQDREGSGQNFVRQLLAIRLAYDCALFALCPEWRCEVIPANSAGGPSQARYIAQLAAENAFRSPLINKLQVHQPGASDTSRKSLQAIFCIDVRSEVYRRALESQSPSIQTIGFAGFFGMPVALDSSALCPVLIDPQYEFHTIRRQSFLAHAGERFRAVWKSLRNSAAACFPAVELAGAWSGLSLLRQSAGRPATEERRKNFTWSIPLEAQVDLAAGALKNMSVDVARLAPVVLICGHGSRTENNPYGSGLDCGACGGHRGDVNARFAAALMNDPAVRQGLAQRGMAVPEDTVFIAGLHNTTTDDVNLFFETAPLAEPLQRTLQGWLDAASKQARCERSSGLMPDAAQLPQDRVEREIRRRSTDWSEVRPEWGLAGNAAFIAAPRERTRALHLQGRAFLHDYDPSLDPDASVLQLILTAPVVVASWINLQYYASTVNNRVFGSGNKVLHNVVGTFGVWEGNGGDLRTGLPLQSLHDGSRWMHEPLRLQVFVEAPRKNIDKVLNANPGVRQLFENSWLHLLSIEGDRIHQFHGKSDWRAIHDAA